NYYRTGAEPEEISTDQGWHTGPLYSTEIGSWRRSPGAVTPVQRPSPPDDNANNLVHHQTEIVTLG
ncbi:MAG TPA: hypothetical protein VNV82_17605, partial [Bryobacteraceae bacterium]|nr:hypothetical protein [Bryobacteraceae bacterium]